MTNSKLTDKKMCTMLFLLCWFVYFTSYLGRLNYSSVMSSMIEDRILTFSQAGTISMIYFFAYGIGQLCNGILGDKLKPQKMIFTGLFFSAAMNFLMGAVRVFPLMTVLWGINGYAQSMIWPPIIRIFAEKYSSEKKLKYSVDIASSMAVGTLMSYFLSACAMQLFTWHAAFYLAAGILAAAAVIWIIGYGKIDRFVKTGKQPSAETQENTEKNTQKNTQENTQKNAQKNTQESTRKNAQKNARAKVRKASFLPLLLSSGLLGVVLPAVIHGILKDGVTQWVPTYIYDRFDVTASFSVIVTMLLPLVNLTGAYMARFAGRKHPDEEIRISSYFFGFAAAALVCLLFLGKYHVLLTAVLFAVITASMMAVNTLYVNLIPLHFEKYGRVSTVSGFLNAAAYLGSALSSFTIGVMVERAGWTVTMAGWIVITGAAFCACIVMRKRKFG